jgi:prepilin-type N-terminal cleavage/methylation domain-containing protein
LAKSNFSSAPGDEAGFSLIETMVATVLLATALASTAHLFVIATRGNLASQRSTFTATLAQEKMEQLRGLAWGYDEIGLPINDYSTNLAVDPSTPTGGQGLSQSPDDSLSADIDGYVDYLDRYGHTLGGGPNVLDGTTYVRRWSIEPLPTNPNNTLILQVLVFNLGDRPDGGTGPVLDRRRDEARLVSVKTRKAR